MSNKSSSLADKLFPEIIEDESEILNIPPEQRKLNTETYDFTVSTINEYINDEHIVIPEFQRGYVWNRSQASRLIESLIIQCPIPVVYLSQNSDETLSVIDGNQRLNSINLFLKEEFSLQGLTAYPELDGFKYSELDPRLQRHIRNRTIRCIVILKDTHPQIKFDVFERLNTGSVKLNPQEIRHGIYHGALMELLEKLAKSKEWKELGIYKADKRMKREELILRFFSLVDDWRNYKKPLSGHISAYSEKNKNNKELVKDLELKFLKSLQGCKMLFGEHAFKTLGDGKSKQKFNAALYDAQMISICELELFEPSINKAKQRKLIKNLRALLHEEGFSKWISQATTDRNSILKRIRRFKTFMNEQIEDVL